MHTHKQIYKHLHIHAYNPYAHRTTWTCTHVYAYMLAWIDKHSNKWYILTTYMHTHSQTHKHIHMHAQKGVLVLK